MTSLELKSSSFSDGDEIPKKYGYKHGNENPPLSINGITSETNSLALIMDDPDAKAAVGKIWVHWVICNIDPNTTEIPESHSLQNTINGKNDFGELGYGGPAPPDKRHTYIFKLYALDTKLDLQNGVTKDQVENAMEGHILEQAILKGTYAP
ncbi:MAG: YbhB/YbcL family Raf kinase inhibitor-like protein [Thaumarchaeota archaeon]|nr:YbhB/YbcL family Raf kinase inhibitor-like protein [Nitrososphaerota archaeon]